ncbi:hypothetical protein CONLIGDRAFT_629712 [Coniochaeta ligniaria NRRL 30616]|uniref:Uncharacterized protein n=1 Tax=Coniochaeta ligniaria NRRL 30616 TaxID=1408157 RepID=A0A1J7JW64_9PEZI|nr:hypothetical protein CONLIGDRAFT_629712 [Coniochaeta ligniaria NRRL 30616]
MAPQHIEDIELPAYSANPDPHKPAAQQPPPSPSPVPVPVPAAAGESSNNPPPPPSRSKLHKLAGPLSLLLGAGITASTTYALVARVQHLIATAAVDSDPKTWISAARTQVYDPCYLGCANDCDDPNYAWNACQRTVQLVADGGSCDANRMWNWAERYPQSCLAAAGDVLRAEALERLKQSYRNQLAIIILTILGGLVGGSIVYCLVRSWAEKRDKAAVLARSRPPPYRSKAPGAGRRRIKLMVAAFVGLFGRRAAAYACVGHDQAADQFFVSPNGTVAGVVHGWFSNCYDTTFCYNMCSTSCRDTGGGGTSCSESCTPYCYTVTSTDKAPWQFVADVAGRVKTCGFRLVDKVEVPVTVRVANANIEKNYWVTIAVNGYNVTRGDETDEGVLCLHQIGG